MTNELDLRYKRIKEISWQGNSDKNKILRQQFTKTLLKVDFSKKTVINIDETWLATSGGTAGARRARTTPVG